LLAILFFGVRPALRQAGVAAQALASGGGGKEILREAPAQVALKPPESDPERLRSQEILDQVTTHLKREPTQSSRLLQSWIHSD
jgi:flagellar M-ring protein FliF